MNAGKHTLKRCTLAGQHGMEVKSMDSRSVPDSDPSATTSQLSEFGQSI